MPSNGAFFKTLYAHSVFLFLLLFFPLMLLNPYHPIFSVAMISWSYCDENVCFNEKLCSSKIAGPIITLPYKLLFTDLTQSEKWIDFELDGIKSREENEPENQLPLTLWQDWIFYVWDFIKYPSIWQFVIKCGQFGWTEQFRLCYEAKRTSSVWIQVARTYIFLTFPLLHNHFYH